jgi:uncharacterized protein (TIGR02452 family)
MVLSATPIGCRRPEPRAAEARGVTSTSVPPPLSGPEVDPHRLAVGKETLAILERGFYEAPSGKRVELRDAIERAVRGTRHYRPGDLGARKSIPGRNLRTIQISDEKGPDAARRIAERGGGDIGILSFASARAPAGGFLLGAAGQEEDLVRCSALYACLRPQAAFYADNRAAPPAAFTDGVLHSPEVPFFRDSSYALLEQPFSVSVVTAPAPHAGDLLRRDPGARPGIRAILESRARAVLRAFAQGGQRTIVLGPWGCGAFQNDPAVVADVFGQLLDGDELGTAFDWVLFAIYDPSPTQFKLRAFQARFG